MSTAYTERTTTRTVVLDESESVPMKAPYSSKYFAAQFVTETLRERSFTTDARGVNYGTTEDYKVTVTGPMLTSTGKRHSSNTGETRFEGETTTAYRQGMDSLPREVSYHLVGSDALRALVVETPEV